MEHTKRKYLAPELTVVSFRTECGYALSGLDLLVLGLKFGSDNGSDNVESRSDGGNWGGDGGWF